LKYEFLKQIIIPYISHIPLLITSSTLHHLQNQDIDETRIRVESRTMNRSLSHVIP